MPLRGLGQPPQRITGRQDLTTEVKITVHQALWSTLFGWIVVLVSRAMLLALLRESVQAWALLEWPARVLYVWWLKLGLPLVPIIVWGSAFCSFLIQVWDINYPPPKAGQRAADGPNAPGILRRLVMPPDPQPDILALMQDRDPEPIEVTRRVQADLTTGKGKTRSPLRQQRTRDGQVSWASGGSDRDSLHEAHPDLTIEQWETLYRAFRNGDSFSCHDLEQYTSQGKALEINRAVREWPDLFKEDEKQKPRPTREFRHWVLGEQWRE